MNPSNAPERPALELSAWARFVETVKIIARHISPMDGPREPFSDEPRRRG